MIIKIKNIVCFKGKKLFIANFLTEDRVKTGTKILLIVLAIILVVIFACYNFFAGNYNKMVALQEEVTAQWSQVENQYQRRLDLIPNLVATVKGYATHEESVFTELAEARAKVGGVLEVSREVLDDPAAFAKFQEIQGELGGALQRLLAVTENYPELKANENFLALQNQLEGTENRIAVERKRYNEKAQQYNVFIKQFPRSLIANMNGFTAKQYFTATEGAQTVPSVTF